MEFFEAPAFTRHVARYWTDEQYRRVQQELAVHPETGDVMPGTGGFRKLRWSDPRRGKGRRGGVRLIYYYFASEQQIWLMTIYGKDELSDLTASERKALRLAVADELAARQARRSRSRASERKR